MKNIARRLSAIERHVRPGCAAEELLKARRAWPIRFAGHCTENAALLDRIAAWREVHFPRSYIPPNEVLDLWDWFMCLSLEAGVGENDGKIGLPPFPAANEKVAIGLIEELCAAANRYAGETGDGMPLPGRAG